MKVDLGTLEADDFFRLALASTNGTRGLATREAVRSWALGVIEHEISRLNLKAVTEMDRVRQLTIPEAVREALSEGDGNGDVGIT